MIEQLTEEQKRDSEQVKLDCLRLAVTLAVTNKQTKGEELDIFGIARDMIELVQGKN